MNCERVRELLPDYLAGSLGGDAEEAIDQHIQNCRSCGDDVAIWGKLGAVGSELPSPLLRTRFDAVLHAYEEGLAEAKSRRRGWLPLRPAFPLAFGMAAASLIVGLAVGHLLTRSSAPAATNGNGEMAQLRDEVRSMRQMVALSLLQQQSASERLRGVTWTRRAAPDQEVTSALLRTLNYDPSVDVRLAAVDALHKVGRDPGVSTGLIESLDRQESPLVQIALIDLLVELKERSAIQALQRMRDDTSLYQAVRDRSRWALEKLQ